MLKILAVLFLSGLLIILFAFAMFNVLTGDTQLDKNKLIDYGNKIIIYDSEGNEISNASVMGRRKSVCLNELKEYTVNAFIAAEDATFYKHKGLNYKRMVKALYKNAIARSFKEGASTISQQLIKNTHLSGDKTISRKLKEIKLTKELEKNYSKDEILEMYLNTIYFGHSCYGLQSAANFYFDKNADDLTLDESATLVGLLSSPNNYSPFKNPEKSLIRRNLVLKCMKNNGFIDETTYLSEKEKPLNATRTSEKESYCDYILEVFEELESCEIDAYKLNDGCKIYTYLNADLQRMIENINYECDNSIIINDVKTGGICAYKSSVNGAKRQPGSTIKPLLVYAPAINEKLINTFTKIDDEKINYGGYSPENYDKKYHGKVTAEESLIKSYNVPAVKILNALGVKTTIKYAEKMHLPIEKSDENLALALGGMKHGVTLKELCNAYSVFPNGGKYIKSNFIKNVLDKNGNKIYERKESNNEVFSEGTCSLINGMLKNTVKNGTAKRLNKFNYDVALKTGTCGFEDGNTDAYALGYTNDKVIGVWLGDKNNKKLQISGGKDCCEIYKIILEHIYKNTSPSTLDVTSGTQEIEIDKTEYNKNGNITLSDDISPKLSRIKCRVLKNNIPKEKLSNFSCPKVEEPQIYNKNNSICIVLCHTEYYDYLVYRQSKSEKKVIYNGKWKKEICDEPKEGTYSYSVIPYYEYKNKKYFGKEIILPSVKIGKTSATPQIKIPDIINGEWYNE